MKVRGNRPVTGTITAFERMRSWTSTARLPGLRMTLDHLLEPGESGVLITEGIEFGGPLSRVGTAILGRRLRRTYEETTAHCARIAEARATAD